MIYHEYLKSSKWKALAKQARDRANNSCEFCNGKPDHVHHVKYPANKDYSGDCIENLIVVCASCHAKQHGIRGKKMNEMTIIDFEGARICCTGSNGANWIRFDDVEKVLGLVGSGWGFRHEQELVKDEDWIRIENPLTRKLEIFLSEEGVLILGSRFGGNSVARRLRRRLAEFALGKVKVEEDLTGLSDHVKAFLQIGECLKAHELRFNYLEKEVGDVKANQQAMVIELNGKLEQFQKAAVIVNDYLTAADYLRTKHEDIDESKFGMFMATFAKRKGCIKNDSGWFSPRGEQLSKRYPSPETRFSVINKWRITFMDYCLPIFKKDTQLSIF